VVSLHRRTVVSIAFVAALIVLVIIAFTTLDETVPLPLDSSGQPLTIDEPGRQWFPQISQNYLVYQDDGSGDWNVYAWDIRAGARIPVAVGPAIQERPSVSGSRVVWQEDEDGDGNTDIHLLDLDSGVRRVLASDPAPQFNPQIFGEVVVWVDERYGSWDIVSYDLRTDQEVVVAGGQEQELYAAVGAGNIAWVEIANVSPTGESGDWNILMHELESDEGQVVADSEDRQFSPSTDGEKVVWHDDRNGQWDIYMFDSSSGEETRITTDKGSQTYPVISGRYIVWQDNRGGDWDVYGYDLETGAELAVATGPMDQEQPRIFESAVTWHENGIDVETGIETDGAVRLVYLPEAASEPLLPLVDDNDGVADRSDKTPRSLPTNPDAYRGPVTDDASLYMARCTLCHTLDRVVGRYEASGFRSSWWRVMVDRMRLNNGAPVSKEEADTIIKYLELTYP